MEFKKLNGKMTYNGQELKLYVEKDTGKCWWTIPTELVPTLNRKHFGMKRELFDGAEEGHTWDILPKETMTVRNMAGSPKKEKANAEHWSNYLSEDDKKLYAELEARGQEARKQAYEANSKQRKIEALKAQLAALEAELAQM